MGTGARTRIGNKGNIGNIGNNHEKTTCIQVSEVRVAFTTFGLKRQLDVFLGDNFDNDDNFFPSGSLGCPGCPHSPDNGDNIFSRAAA